MDWNNTLSIDEFFVFNGTLSSNITSSSSSLDVVRPAGAAWPSWYEAGRIQIPFYAVIFVLAVTGNLLVIFTLVKNQRMRTITNLFLLNLAISDLLLGVLCMPFTLIGALLRDFVFGPVMCKLLPFLQGENMIEFGVVNSKFKIERVKQKVESYYTIRNYYSDFYEHVNPKLQTVKEGMNNQLIVPIPKLIDDKYRLIVFKMKDNEKGFNDDVQLALVVNLYEIRMLEDFSLSDIILFDFEYVTMTHIYKTGLAMVRRAADILEKLYNNRIKAVHIVNYHPICRLLYKMASLVLKKKLIDRVKFHDSIESLYKHIPKESLPRDYGGDEKSLDEIEACSVSVGVWTLVAISVERYYAICHPLRSLRWQTLSHAYKLILAIWIGSIICMAPIAALSQLQPTRQGNQKCRENWSSVDCEKAYNLFLDAVLLVIPLLVMAVTYSLITMTLCKGMKTEKLTRSNQVQNNSINVYVNLKGGTSTRSSYRSSFCPHPVRQRLQPNWSQDSSSPSIGSRKLTTGLRRTNAERSLSNKKRIIKMLFAVVLEFFICWTPLYVVNTITLFDATLVYESVGITGVSFFQLLAYTSSCCNPITYCFMNLGFRKAFVSLFSCSRRLKSAGMNGSEINMETKWTNRLSEPA